MKAVKVEVTNKEERGTVTISSSSDPPRVGETLTAKLEDPDGIIPMSETWTWQRQAEPNNQNYMPPWIDIDNTNSTTYMPVAADIGYQLRVYVTYTDGHGPNKERDSPASKPVSASLLEVAFSAANYTLIESGNPVGPRGVRGQADDPTEAANRKRVSVGVALTPVLDRRVMIPITVTAGSAESADYGVRGLDERGRVIFAPSPASSDESSTELSGRIKEFIIAANPDADFDDETIQVGFGTPLPAGVRVGIPATALVTLYDTPSAPTGLTAEGGHEQVRLRWDDPGNGGITGWQYQQRRTGGGSLWSEWMNMARSDAQTTAHTVRGLSNGVNYRFKVRAFNTWGRGAESSSVSARPSSFIAEAAPGSVRLRWDDPRNTEIDRWEYRVRRVPDKWGPWEPIAGSDATTTAHTVRELDGGVLYRFKVRAVSSSGASVLTLSAVEATPQVLCQLTGATAPTFAENALGVVGTYRASAGCGSALSWGLAGTDARFFELKGEGMSRPLEFDSSHSPPNFERPADADKNNTYAVSVSIGDVSVPVIVSVTDADDAGVVSLSTPAPRAGESITATLSDEDGIAEPVSWTPHYEGASAGGGVTGQASEATQTWTLSGRWPERWTSAGTATSATVHSLTNGQSYSFITTGPTAKISEEHKPQCFTA